MSTVVSRCPSERETQRVRLRPPTLWAKGHTLGLDLVFWLSESRSQMKSINTRAGPNPFGNTHEKTTKGTHTVDWMGS